ncbi:squalene-hopene cyclase [Rhypophila decipiens]|uniref:Terpene cyclase/mutase family member n=1 Tax=Rhypophila decipiens TaxID=261697 RepID=A0AAN7B5Q4_9PEZI|nr:squalene-hopene cyclase [Rhypophila decipiens]
MDTITEDRKQTMPLKHQTERAIRLATEHAKLLVHPDGHWAGPLLSDTTFTTQYIFTLLSLNQPISEADRKSFIRFFLSAQEEDGSWALAPKYPYGGSLSVTVETYMALKMMGFSPSHPIMEKARTWILEHGGIEKVRNTTRVFLAMFGILSWSSIPQLPPELIFLPTWSPLSIFRTGMWARTIIVPLLVLRAYEPVYPLPRTVSSSEVPFYLDELWCTSSTPGSANLQPRILPYTKPSIPLLLSNPISFLFQLLDLLLLYMFNPVLSRLPARRLAIEACIRYMMDRQDPEGPYGGFTICLCLYLQCLALEGHVPCSSRQLRTGLEALRSNVREWPDVDMSGSGRSDHLEKVHGQGAKKIIRGQRGKYLQGSTSPIWDTLLMARGLMACHYRPQPGQDLPAIASDSLKGRDGGCATRKGRSRKKDDKIDELVRNALDFIRSKEIRDQDIGDWQVYRPHLQPGSYSFEYVNRWFPDVDDTAVAVLAFLEAQDRHEWARILRAAKWCLGMQNGDGGWAAFDSSDGTKWLWNSILFSDMDCMCDSSCPDVTGRCLEMFGLLRKRMRERAGAMIRNEPPILGKQTGEEEMDEDHETSIKRREEETVFEKEIDAACQKGINYLQKQQAPFGGFWARWGINYLYGTSNALCGLFYFGDIPHVQEMISKGVAWIESVQNPDDGGWGEQDDSFVDPARAGKGESTPSQTAWAIMALLRYVPPTRGSVVRGVRYLIETQVVCTDQPSMGRSLGAESREREIQRLKGEGKGVENGTWEQETYTGVGHPNQVCFGYDMYRHYFPMIALGRYLMALNREGGNLEHDGQ